MLALPPTPAPEEALRDEILTPANLVTAIRLTGGLAAFGVFWTTGSPAWNYAGLAVYWAGDILDGWLARRRGEETVFGAQFDILADRLLVCTFYLGYLSLFPAKTVAVLLFLFEFAVIDHFLSNQFIRWPILSPNHFYLVDRRIWRLLWSTPAKALNTGLVTLMLIFLPWQVPAIVATLALLGVRAWAARRMLSMSADATERIRPATCRPRGRRWTPTLRWRSAPASCSAFSAECSRS